MMGGTLLYSVTGHNPKATKTKTRKREAVWSQTQCRCSTYRSTTATETKASEQNYRIHT